MPNRNVVGRVWRPLLLTAALASSGFAQSTQAALFGTVRDTGGTPVSLARLSVSNVLTISDSTGRFYLAGLPTGAGKLLVRRLGFEPLDLSLLLFAGRADSLTVVLTFLPQDLPGVTTRADALAQIQAVRLSHRSIPPATAARIESFFRALGNPSRLSFQGKCSSPARRTASWSPSRS